MMLTVMAVAAWLAPPAAAGRISRVTLNPKTYKSALGAYALRVDPSTMYGQGEGRYRMTHDGAEVWAKTLPFTLWDCAVGDDGIVAGYAYSLGYENRPVDRKAREDGKAHLVILDARGELRMNDVLPRRGQPSDASTVDRNVNGFMLDPENDRFIVRLEEGGWFLQSETWCTYQLSDGKLLDEFTFAHPTEGDFELWFIRSAKPVAGTPLILVNWEYTKWNIPAQQVRATGGCYNLIDPVGEPVWELDRPGDYPEYSEYRKRLDERTDRLELARLSQIEGEINKNGAILRTDEPRCFDLWFVKENQRVTFEIEGNVADGWQVTEHGRATYNPTTCALPEEQTDKLDSLTLRHLGTIRLRFSWRSDFVALILGETPGVPRLGAIGDVAVDQQGMIYIAESQGGRTHIFDSSGQCVRQLHPDPDDFKGWWSFHGNVNVAGDGSVFVGRLEFSPSGERVGFRTLPAIQEDMGYSNSRVCYQPHSQRFWVIAEREAYLVDEDNTVLTCLRRKPDDTWLDWIEASAVAPDGSLALATGSFNMGSRRGAERGVISLYNSAGEPLKTIKVPSTGEEWLDWRRIVYSGRYVLAVTHSLAAPHNLLLDTAADPPKWYDLDAIAPCRECWQCFVVHDGQELWLIAELARKVERYALPAGSSPTDTD
jgi:hypothetical protein